MLGAYVAFTRPGKHRLSVQNGINMDLKAREEPRADVNVHAIVAGQSVQHFVLAPPSLPAVQTWS